MLEKISKEELIAFGWGVFATVAVVMLIGVYDDMTRADESEFISLRDLSAMCVESGVENAVINIKCDKIDEALVSTYDEGEILTNEEVEDFLGG